ncbi:unnamed protein product [Pipistrellus nathusii]|uniref:Uncharacterized protein n=1 Tax=Pipistrellus nathusii TaxID=59473 RepID=A0ABP0A7T8_PIPNA
MDSDSLAPQGAQASHSQLPIPRSPTTDSNPFLAEPPAAPQMTMVLTSAPAIFSPPLAPRPARAVQSAVLSKPSSWVDSIMKTAVCVEGTVKASLAFGTRSALHVFTLMLTRLQETMGPQGNT